MKLIYEWLKGLTPWYTQWWQGYTIPQNATNCNWSWLSTRPLVAGHVWLWLQSQEFQGFKGPVLAWFMPKTGEKNQTRLDFKTLGVPGLWLGWWLCHLWPLCGIHRTSFPLWLSVYMRLSLNRNVAWCSRLSHTFNSAGSVFYPTVMAAWSPSLSFKVGQVNCPWIQAN